MHTWNLWSSVPPIRLRTTALEPERRVGRNGAQKVRPIMEAWSISLVVMTPRKYEHKRNDAIFHLISDVIYSTDDLITGITSGQYLDGSGAQYPVRCFPLSMRSFFYILCYV